MIAKAVAVSSNAAGTRRKSSLAKAIQRAMEIAIMTAYSEGVTEPAEVRLRMMAAREEAKKNFVPPADEA